jgi:hypothetical protein
MGQAALRVLNLPQTFKRVTRDDSELKHASGENPTLGALFLRRPIFRLGF